MIRRIAFALAASVSVAAGASAQTCIASVYSGGHAASGERVHAWAFTAAHRSLPFGSLVRVTNLHNGRAVVVRINDRGPFVRGRCIDLVVGAARMLGLSGLARVDVEQIGKGVQRGTFGAF